MCGDHGGTGVRRHGSAALDGVVRGIVLQHGKAGERVPEGGYANGWHLDLRAHRKHRGLQRLEDTPKVQGDGVAEGEVQNFHW